MRSAWQHTERMGLIQVRDVPEDLHREIKARAAAAGVSLSEYVRNLMVEHVRRPTMEQALRRIAKREPWAVEGESFTETVRRMRDAWD